MKKNLKITILVLSIILISMSVYFIGTKKVIEKNPIQAESIVGCYVAHLAKDVYSLEISSEVGENIQGKLDIQNAEKDSSTGTIVGTYKKDIILADYTFQSEGVESINWVAFKKIRNSFVRGYGDVGAETKTQNIDLNKITFDTSVVYSKTNCTAF